MNGSQKDDADALAAYAERLLERAEKAMAEAASLNLRARIAIKEAQAIIKPCSQKPKLPSIVEWANSAE